MLPQIKYYNLKSRRLVPDLEKILNRYFSNDQQNVPLLEAPESYRQNGSVLSDASVDAFEILYSHQQVKKRNWLLLGRPSQVSIELVVSGDVSHFNSLTEDLRTVKFEITKIKSITKAAFNFTTKGYKGGVRFSRFEEHIPFYNHSGPEILTAFYDEIRTYISSAKLDVNRSEKISVVKDNEAYKAKIYCGNVLFCGPVKDVLTMREFVLKKGHGINIAQQSLIFS